VDDGSWFLFCVGNYIMQGKSFNLTWRPIKTVELSMKQYFCDFLGLNKFCGFIIMIGNHF